ncbi:MAG TPA: cation diffusion facilitator family transporter [Acidimicrobiia bacterium]|nr:cation diffusion facilitator family transporter [Acidimicrobiia bacterium]
MGMAHDHGHRAAGRAGARHAHRLLLVLVMTTALVVVQGAAAIAFDSLALLSDTGHVLTDALGIGMALAAVRVADRRGRGRDPQHTFGWYRLEILAALVNAVLLVGVAVYVLVEAVQRIDDPPRIDAGWVLAAATVGLIVNLAAYLALRPGADESINVRGAQLEVLADLIGSIAVVVAAALVAITDVREIDAVAGAVIALFILPRAVALGRSAARVLLQSAPPHIDVDAVRADLARLPGVVDVHDLHVWTLTSDMDVLSAHLVVTSATDLHGVLDDARALLRSEHAIAHATLQVEPDDHAGCAEVDW